MILSNILTLLFVRPLAEKAFDRADKSTAGRITSILQGLLCTIQLINGQWKEAIGGTLAHFTLDLFFEEIYHLPRQLDMKIHHLAGIALCSMSLYFKTYQNGPKSNITRALITLEVCNPLLHFLIIMKKEDQLYRFPNYCKNAMKYALITQFFLIRVLTLGTAFFQFAILNNAAFDYLITVISGIIWCLQIYWFRKLIKNAQA